MNKEIWKDIFWYEWLYQVSNIWNVKSLFRYKKTLKPKKRKDWYLEFNLYKNKKVKFFRWHRLVASAFLWCKLEFVWNNLVCHKNDIRDDNRIENLFLGTHKDNAQDCIKKGRWTDNSWEKNGMNIYAIEKIDKVKLLIKEWYKNIDIEKTTGVYHKTVSDIRRKKRWR